MMKTIASAFLASALMQLSGAYDLRTWKAVACAVLIVSIYMLGYSRGAMVR